MRQVKSAYLSQTRHWLLEFGLLFVTQPTLQELKLRGIKICDGVVLSQYSRVKCFAIHLSIFWHQGRGLYGSVIEHWTCKRKVLGPIPLCSFHANRTRGD